jgi:hypothetical protein
MRRSLALMVGLALTGCSVQKGVKPAGETANPSIPSAMPGSGVTLPGSALSAMPVSGHGGPMEDSLGMKVPYSQEPVMDQTGSQAIGDGPAEYRRDGPATIQ